MQKNMVKSLTLWTEFQVRRATARAAEQRRRLESAEQQARTIVQYAGQMTEKGNQWLSNDEGCPAFLMRGAEGFQGTIQVVLATQRNTVENLRDTYDGSLRQVHAAQQDARRIAHVASQQVRRERAHADKAEQKLNDDLSGNQHLRKAR